MQLQFITNNHSSKPVRIEKDNQNNLWFNANDVCDILGYAKPNNAVQNHVFEEDVTKRDILTKGGKQEMTYINESGLYALIFGSHKAEAKLFKRYVTNEVLPIVRKYGSYSSDAKKMAQIVKKAERKAVVTLLTEVNSNLSGSDKRLVGKQCLTDEHEVQQVLNGRKEDVHMMSLLYAKASGNKQYRGLFYSHEGADRLYKELLNKKEENIIE